MMIKDLIMMTINLSEYLDIPRNSEMETQYYIIRVSEVSCRKCQHQSQTVVISLLDKMKVVLILWYTVNKVF